MKNLVYLCNLKTIKCMIKILAGMFKMHKELLWISTFLNKVAIKHFGKDHWITPRDIFRVWKKCKNKFDCLLTEISFL